MSRRRAGSLDGIVQKNLSGVGDEDGMVVVLVALESQILDKKFRIEDAERIARTQLVGFTAWPVRGSYMSEPIEHSVALVAINCCEYAARWKRFSQLGITVARMLGASLGQRSVIVMLFPPTKYTQKNWPEYYAVTTKFENGRPKSQAIVRSGAKPVTVYRE